MRRAVTTATIPPNSATLRDAQFQKAVPFEAQRLLKAPRGALDGDVPVPVSGPHSPC